MTQLANDTARRLIARLSTPPVLQLSRGLCRLTLKRNDMLCLHMRGRYGDLSMTHEHYDCAVCGGHVAIDYDEIR